jgi:hypothetical protein
MDTSIRPEQYITGSLKIKAEEIDAEGWFHVLKEIMSICKAHLKYLSGFKPIEESINNFRNLERTKDEAIKAFPGFSKKMLCRVVGQISHETEGEFGGGVRFYTCENLLLTKKGYFVFWKAKYERAYWIPRDKISSTAEYSHFSKLSLKEASKIISVHPKLGLNIIAQLRHEVNEGIRDRERRVAELRNMDRDLYHFEERFQE